MASEPTSLLSGPQRAFLLTLAQRIVPEVRSLDPQEEAQFWWIIEDALAGRSPALCRQFNLFLNLLRWLPALRYGAPLDHLPPERQDSVLRWFQGAPIPLIRKGFWGLKALLFMGFYGRPGVGERLGYHPSRQGNEMLRTSGTGDGEASGDD